MGADLFARERGGVAGESEADRARCSPAEQASPTPKRGSSRTCRWPSTARPGRSGQGISIKRYATSEDQAFIVLLRLIQSGHRMLNERALRTRNHRRLEKLPRLK